MENDKLVWLSDVLEILSKRDAPWNGFVNVQDLLAVDAVEVVRCRECKRWERLEFSPLHFCPEVHEFTDAEFFCKRGKRREEEHNAVD